MTSLIEAIKIGREIIQDAAQDSSRRSKEVNDGVEFVVDTFTLNQAEHLKNTSSALRTQARKLNSYLKKKGY